MPWAAFVGRCGLFETLSASAPVVRTSPNAAPVDDVRQSFALTVLCDRDRFAHVQRLWCDPTLAELFGVERIVAGRRLLGVIPAEKAGAFWDRTRHQFEADVSNLDPAQASGWQLVELDRQRAATENVFDELKPQWGFDGFCSGKKNVTALAARLGLLVCNLWHLFLRLIEPGRHVESKGGRRWLLLIAGRLTQSGRQKPFSIGVAGAWWEQLKADSQRICRWLAQTAPQLKPPNARAPDFAFLPPATQ